ncbi:E2/UBC family protein [Candidatus Spongiihabitans sp.]|uniref:E2/UBC family protein n=1 Tax=Candidatus Spongiihabitans sp. TaxID=3101308 RepID=UPI003C7DF26D
MDFALPDDDVGLLNNTFPSRWKTIVSTVERGIVISRYALPVGYTLSEVEIMILIPQDYPMAQLDMFYLSPDVAKTNGNAIGAVSNELHFNRQWQRWSRHYQWQVGINNIATHLGVVKNALETELLK